MSSNENRKYHRIQKEPNDCRFWFLSPLVYGVKQPCDSKKCKLPKINPQDTECRYRPFLTIGLLFLELLKRILLPVSGCGVGVVYAKEKEEKCDPSRKLVRACELPIYASDEKKCLDCAPSETLEHDSLFTETVKCARKELWFLMDQAHIIRKQMGTCVEELKAESEDVLKYLREESNLVPRVGAIAVGGLTGYILALRRGAIRKFLYTSTGTGLMAALCYPREAKEYSQEGFKELKKYFIVGYHFFNGVSRDLTGYQLPPLPNGHFFISDSAHHGSEAVPSSAHLLPPTATPTHIPLPHEDPHEITKNHYHHQISDSD